MEADAIDGQKDERQEDFLTQFGNRENCLDSGHTHLAGQ